MMWNALYIKDLIYTEYRSDYTEYSYQKIGNMLAAKDCKDIVQMVYKGDGRLN